MPGPSYSEVNKKLQAGLAAATPATPAQPAPEAAPQAEPVAQQAASLTPEDQAAAAVGAQAMAEAAPAEEKPSVLSQIGTGLASTVLQLLPRAAGYATGGKEGLARVEVSEAEDRARKERQDKEDKELAAKKEEKRLEAEAKRLELLMKKSDKAETREISLREELGKNKQVMSAAESGQSFTVLQNLYKQSKEKPDAIKDVSLVYNFVKALDPGSTVRESEADLIQNAKGLMGAVPGLYERIKSGQKLLPEQRDAMLQAAADAYQGRVQNVQPIIETYGALANKYGVDPNAVVGVMGFPKAQQFDVARQQGALGGDIAKLPMKAAIAAEPASKPKTMLINGELHQKDASGRWMPVK